MSNSSFLTVNDVTRIREGVPTPLGPDPSPPTVACRTDPEQYDLSPLGVSEVEVRFVLSGPSPTFQVTPEYRGKTGSSPFLSGNVPTDLDPL